MKHILYFLLISVHIAAMAQPTADNDKSIESHYEGAKLEYKQFEEVHGGYVQTDHVLMHYLTWGNPNDIPLIWSHGSFSHAYELMTIADKLALAGYYVIAIDHYGHGKTPIPEHAVSIYHIADDISVLLDSLGIDKAVVGGFSRGGYISTAFYESYPERVMALILEDGGSVAFNSFHHRMNKMDLERKARSMDNAEDLDNPYSKLYDSEFDAYQSLYDKSVGGYQFEILSIVNSKDGKWFTYRGLMDFFHMADSSQFMDLVLKPNKVPLYAASITMVQPKIVFRNLQVPILILDPISENDPMPFEEENKALERKSPSLITGIEYADTEHNIHYQHPESFLKDLIGFLNSVK